MKDIKWEDAPEWADRLMECRFVKYWCSVERYTEVGLNKDSDLFKIGGVTIGDLSLIEMRPEQQEDNAGWLPVVGEECEVKYFHESEYKWEKCFVIGNTKDDKCFVINVYHDDSLHFAFKQSGSLEFRPLKTDEQKDKEAFDLKAYKVYRSCMTYNEFATALFKAGFTAPEGEL
ncbi:MAG: hypothetical protein V7765_21565 [Oleispira sp.]